MDEQDVKAITSGPDGSSTSPTAMRSSTKPSSYVPSLAVSLSRSRPEELVRGDGARDDLCGYFP
jgi:hypothetical protein